MAAISLFWNTNMAAVTSRANTLFKYLLGIKRQLESGLRTFARKSSTQQIFLKLMLSSDNELLMSEMQKKIKIKKKLLGDRVCHKLP